LNLFEIDIKSAKDFFAWRCDFFMSYLGEDILNLRRYWL
jgi:hypothetical protein